MGIKFFLENQEEDRIHMITSGRDMLTNSVCSNVMHVHLFLALGKSTFSIQAFQGGAHPKSDSDLASKDLAYGSYHHSSSALFWKSWLLSLARKRKDMIIEKTHYKTKSKRLSRSLAQEFIAKKANSQN